MDKTTILKAFNNQFEEFLEDVEVLFPENNDIKTATLKIRKIMFLDTQSTYSINL